jgi:FMN phosphatase YigB (HAD superfamily)
MALRAIVFDLFDTLVDLHFDRLPETRVRDQTLRGSTVTLHEIARDFVPLDVVAFAAELRESDRALYEHTYKVGLELPVERRFRAFAERLGVTDPDFVSRLGSAHMGVLRSVAEAPAHHREVLETLSREFRIGICSNFSDGRTARSVLDEAGLLDSFHAVVISEENGFRKPRSEIFEDVLSRLETDPAETLHVGDSLVADVAGAAGARINTAWLTRRVRDPEAALADYDGPRPEYTLADLAELVGLSAG